jgi:hypothetical protein
VLLDLNVHLHERGLVPAEALAYAERAREAGLDRAACFAFYTLSDAFRSDVSVERREPARRAVRFVHDELRRQVA